MLGPNENTNENTKDVPTDQFNQEAGKLYHDNFKHLATLNTGSIVIIVSFLEKFFKNPLWKILVVFSLSCFVLSIFTSLLTMFFVVDLMRSPDEFDEYSEKFGASLAIISVTGFLLGIICLIIFTVKNLYGN